ncbi:unnamed protein product [Eruca vesicaria subsp. sativa]|uniref:Uncharacterized protein n=1 Tax=Eruca vesicaria subsp. sativa TaxID=29727 RepID=A0ABC8LNS3_ERUVS|nr:unnamed protein product [Eruca vesicaria subsp. sativa]
MQELMPQHGTEKKADVSVVPHERSIFTKHTRQKLESSQKKVEPVPLIGFFTEKIVELLVGAQSRFTYISGS